MQEERQPGTSTARVDGFFASIHVRLTFRETNKISHYLINRVQEEDKAGDAKYKIGEQFFPDVASLLNFYKLHYLETTPLVSPAPRQLESVVAKFDFVGQVPHCLLRVGVSLQRLHH